ncbi:Bacterial transcription activator, effector binding domain [Planctomycetes bacterium CA13]|uniref:Bacterial transcription activator, effector binding domain n=1 Tax=Novipirellula herctigrandis TaxID=2527986 RepID=A0A5C5Z7K8_9BACT|nr:Bacterial transcription activator, effector binding domain [Planctomycetes bacterium CA13]
MPAYHVERSIQIDAPVEKVFDTVVDFSTWTTWSPWLCVDKSAEVTVSADPNSVGSQYAWVGEVVGQGEMEHLRLDRPRSIADEIRFVKPFKSKSNVSFRLESIGQGAKITWIMDGNLPWFMFWMRSQMETFIAMDYDRGLRMLKEYIETGTVLSETEVVGVESADPITVVGAHNSCVLEAISPAMEKAFTAVIDSFSEAGISTETEMISVYHDFDMKSGRFEFTSGFAVAPGCHLPSGLVSRDLAGGKVLHLRHIGSYGNLGNAWSGAYQYARYKKIKILKQAGYEVYRNDPKTTPVAELVTDIYLPIK